MTLQTPPDDLGTRAGWEALADQLLGAVQPFASPGFGQYRLPGRASQSGQESDGLEGYARTFLLAAFRIAGARGEVDQRLIDRYAAGLAAGTDPASGPGEAWLPVTDRKQPMVEAASIALGLHETRPWLWDRLDDKVRAHVADWLGGFIGAEPHDNNWLLFQVVAEQFLASVGAPHSQADIDRGLDRIEDWYRGDGWYTDGDGRHFDHYNGWAMHLYPLLWARIAGASADAGRVAAYRERLRRFLGTYAHFIGGDGAPMHQGRSLTYRWAAAAPLWMGELADCSPLPPGMTRRAASGMLRHFTAHGVPDERGLLTLGWHRPFLPMAQDYSGPASPYWASKGFAGLLLPPEHPAWTAPEEQLPVETGDFSLALPQPGWLLHGTRADGVVRLVNHGTDHQFRGAPPSADPHYSKFGYSTATAPETGEAAWRRGVDGHLALLPAGADPAEAAGEPRRRIHAVEVAPGRASSWHEARVAGDPEAYKIATTSLVHGRYEVRVHRVFAPVGVTVREGGYAVAGDTVRAETGPGLAVARGARVASAVVALHGWDEETGIAHATDANALGPRSASPYLLRRAHPGGRTVHVTLVVLSGEPLDAAWLHSHTTVTITSQDEVTVRLPDGTGLNGWAPGP
uniref:DUF2264 domain-containing protein n=1 Tax=Streptomyces sp. N35 TaxID=2795730 RepID=UPI0018F45EAA